MMHSLRAAWAFTQEHPYLTAGGAVALAYGAEKVAPGTIGAKIAVGAAALGGVNAAMHAFGPPTGGAAAVLRGQPPKDRVSLDADEARRYLHEPAYRKHMSDVLTAHRPEGTEVRIDGPKGRELATVMRGGGAVAFYPRDEDRYSGALPTEWEV